MAVSKPETAAAAAEALESPKLLPLKREAVARAGAGAVDSKEDTTPE